MGNGLSDSKLDGWTNSAESAATFPPGTVSVTPLDDYKQWAQESRGWRKIEAAVLGGAALTTSEGQEYAATRVSVESVMTAAVAFQRTQDLLIWLEQAIRDALKSMVGDGKPWKGQAADAFKDHLTTYADYLGKQAEHFAGGAVPESTSPSNDVNSSPNRNSLPAQLYDAANYLSWAQQTIDYLDRAWATIAHDAGGVGDDGKPVPISGSDYEKPMAQQMASVVETLDGQYQMTTDKTSAPSSATSSNYSVPSVNFTTPNFTQPNISTPNVSTPNISTPNISTPNISTPNISTPNISTPNISSPDLSQPNLSTPDLSTPNLSTPDLSQPNLSTPNLSTPNISTPDLAGVTSPDGIVTPNISTPSFSSPSFSGPGGTGSTGSGLPGFDGSGVNSPVIGGLSTGQGSGSIIPPTIPTIPKTGSGSGGGQPNGVQTPEFSSPTISSPDIGGVGAGTGTGTGMPNIPGLGSPGAGGAGAGSGGSGIPETPDANGLLGNNDDFKPGAISGVDIPESPVGAAPGSNGFQSPMMPGMPGSGGGAGSGSGSGIPDAPDSKGLVGGDASDWESPGISGVDVPESPAGTASGGAGLGTGMPSMPGMPGAGAGGANGSGIPDAPDSKGLVDGNASDWESPQLGGVDVPNAPTGAAAGGDGFTTPDAPSLPVTETPPADAVATQGASTTLPGNAVPMMPGAPGGGANTGTGIPDSPDASGLIGADASDWSPSDVPQVDVPSAPTGASAGGAGLETPPGNAPPAVTPDVTAADTGTPDLSAPVTSVPDAGAPRATVPDAGLPDPTGPDAQAPAAPVAESPADEAPTAEFPAAPDASAPFGSAGPVDVPPPPEAVAPPIAVDLPYGVDVPGVGTPAATVNGTTGAGTGAGAGSQPAAGPVHKKAGAVAAAGDHEEMVLATGAIAVAGIGAAIGVAGPGQQATRPAAGALPDADSDDPDGDGTVPRRSTPDDDDPEPADRPDAAEALREDDRAWGGDGAQRGQAPPADDRVPVVGPDDDPDDLSDWDDVSDSDWLTGAQPGDNGTEE